jgi:hypothetical protein
MTKVSILAESMNHHPEWTNVYNRVEVWVCVCYWSEDCWMYYGTVCVCFCIADDNLCTVTKYLRSHVKHIFLWYLIIIFNCPHPHV